MFISACDTMRKVVILSASLFLIGILLEIMTQLITFESMISVFFAYAGIFAIGLGLVILLGVFIAMMIPAVSHHLDACQH